MESNSKIVINGSKFDEDILKQHIQNIKKYNDETSEHFSFVEEAMKKLNVTWTSPASNMAMKGYFKIKDKMQMREETINDYIKYLNEIIIPGYIDTENENIKLADAFK